MKNGEDGMTEKRFTIIYNEHSKMMQYVDNCKEEPNRWAIWNASETAQKLNELNNENEQLKQSYKEFEDECQSTFNAMNRKQNDLYRKNFKLKEENEQLKVINKYLIEILEHSGATVEIEHIKGDKE